MERVVASRSLAHLHRCSVLLVVRLDECRAGFKHRNSTQEGRVWAAGPLLVVIQTVRVAVAAESTEAPGTGWSIAYNFQMRPRSTGSVPGWRPDRAAEYCER